MGLQNLLASVPAHLHGYAAGHRVTRRSSRGGDNLGPVRTSTFGAGWEVHVKANIIQFSHKMVNFDRFLSVFRNVRASDMPPFWAEISEVPALREALGLLEQQRPCFFAL